MVQPSPVFSAESYLEGPDGLRYVDLEAGDGDAVSLNDKLG